MKDEDGDFTCIACGATVGRDRHSRISGFDRHVWLMQTAADGYPHPVKRRHPAREWRTSDTAAGTA